MRWLIIIIVAVAIGAVAGFLVALSPLLESEDHGRFITLLITLLLAMGVCACAAGLLLRSANKRIAYLGVLPCIILGGILGVFASILLLSALDADIDNIHMQIGIVLGACIGGALAIIRVRLHRKAPTEEALAKLLTSLPENAGSLIKQIIAKMRYRKSVQNEVMAELAAHFEDELRDCKSDEERSQKAEKPISDFGDAKLLGILLRRAKIRCRPLWRTMVARTFQAIGILILFFIVYVIWFLTGKPLISVDYLAQLNQMVRPVADESLNAAPLYEKAADVHGRVSDDMLTFFAQNYKTIGELQYGGRFRRRSAHGALSDDELADAIREFFANRGRPDVRHEMRRKIEAEVTWRINRLLPLEYLETTAAERQFIHKWIVDQKEALDLVVAGTHKPYHWWDYGDGQDTYIIWSIHLPELSELKMLTRALSWRAWLSAEQGRYEDALGDVMTCYRFGRHHTGNRTLIEQLVGMAIEALAVRNLRDILGNYEIDYQILTKLQKDFEQTIAGEDFTVHFEVEKLSMY
ncbi:MAG: flagellar basal body-associated FliL family protein, partial [Planctomycetota bacterium]